jgi:DNA-directed RNA polymerase II subunit RPB1
MSFNKEIVNVKSVQFTVLGNDDIKRISVLDANGVIYPDTYDNSEPKIGGIIDPRLGVTDQFMLCSFCKQNYMECPGHFGHVKLTEPVFHFGFIHYVKNVLSCVCFKTCKLLISKEDISKKVINNRNQKQRFNEIKTLCASVKYSPYSGIPTPSLKVETRKSVGTIQIIAEYTVNQADDFDIGKNVTIDNISDTKKKVVQVLTAADCYHILSNISDDDCYLIGIPRPENMIIINFPVPPVAIRPSLRGDFTSMGYSEHGTTHKLSDIVKFNNKLGKEKEKALSTNDNSKYLKDYQDCLQYHVATFFDNESTQLPKSELKSGGNAAKSITSRFKGGKTGRIRGNLQGKRVDFSARTVITSDPNNNLDELGVPLKIAMIVTYPEIVTDANIDYLRLLIKNGRSKYPGANFIENTSIIGPNGKPVKIDLGYKNEGIILQKGWIVHRHLQNEDYVLFNRQPSLHKMSMMTHKVKGIEFQWFLNDIKEIRKEGNITYFPVNQRLFNESLINCHGILTGGGFETPAEALFLNKKILSIPIQNHYEQECNAAALKLLGVPVLNKVGDDFHIEIENWLNGVIQYPKIQANDIPKTLQFLFDTYND